MTGDDATATPSGASAVTGEVRITNPQGLHLRPAAAFAQLVAETGCRVRVRSGQALADGRSVLELAMLAAPKGALLAITVDGEGCVEALAALTKLVAEFDS